MVGDNLICYAFRDGKCNRGGRCKFSHNKSSRGGGSGRGGGRGGFNSSSTSNSTHRGGHGFSRGESSGRGGRALQMRHTGNMAESLRLMRQPTVSASETSILLTNLNDILDTGNPNLSQDIIKALSSQEGLTILRHLLEQQYVIDREPMLREFGFWKHCVPLLKVLSHDEVRSSLVLESCVGTIYNVVYGLSGERGIPFFQRVAAGLTERVNKPQTSDTVDLHGALTAAARTLYVTLTVNQSASIQSEFKEVARAFAAVYASLSPDSTNYAHQLAASELNKVKQKINLGELVREAQQPKATAESLDASFYVNIDHPGEASQYGPRHDNDKRDILKIAILPTANEMFTDDSRAEYLPVRDPNAPLHHLPQGRQRLIDAQFRMLREDNSGQLRDAVKLIMAGWKDQSKAPLQLTKGAAQTATVLFTAVKIEGFEFSDRKGFSVDVSFDQPKAITKKLNAPNERTLWWNRSKYLQEGSLICLVNREECIFFIVENRIVNSGRAHEDQQRRQMRQNYGVFDLAGHQERALINLRLADVQKDHRAVVINYINRRRNRTRSEESRKLGVQFLVEFPGLLFNSFDPILQCLKKLMSSDVPFTKWIAPDQTTMLEMSVLEDGVQVLKLPPPMYMLRQTTPLDLSCLRRPEFSATEVATALSHSIANPCSVDSLKKYTTLDTGQCLALIGGLSKELALIQGPPGTGKSFVGVKLVKALLENRTKLDIGPIVCVCYTNHALDQFLVDLLLDGAKQIIRLGSRSKAPELAELTLQVKSKGMDSTATERKTNYDARAAMEEVGKTMSRSILPKVVQLTTATAVRDYLKENDKAICQQLFGSEEEDEDGFRVHTKKIKPAQVISKWLDLTHLPPPPHLTNKNAGRPTPELKQVRNMKLLNRSERYRLLHSWENDMQAPTFRQLVQELKSFETSKQNQKHGWNERDKRCLQSAHVIGVTTTGLATHAELLRSLKARVLVCEEAGEVLEAHSLVALLPSVEHAILIGDHQQLRPHIANYSLSMESRLGEKYRLDESLFERLTNEQFLGPENVSLKFPIVTLDTQRRMHPSIASLIRETLYPKLIDHPDTTEHPPVRGLARRLFWFNHQEYETNADHSDPTATSKTNMFEVDMTAALVKHLFRQGHYKAGRIAVLTPYLGQMMRLKDKLNRMFEIVIGDKDQDQLDAENLEADVADIKKEAGNIADTKPSSSSSVVRKTALLTELRLATVDNFQGEEADIIVISLVRSNPQQQCGFLKTSNRINVLLSRARHGMYIIGNATTARSIPMWADVITLLENGDNIGPSLQLCCERHPDKIIHVQSVNDFEEKSPEGGCEERCGQTLPKCGHTCRKQCHSLMLHNAEICDQECRRGLPGCQHPCQTSCGLECRPCQVSIPVVALPCRHVARDVPCHEAQHPDQIKCVHPVLKTLERCGHELSVACYVDVNADGYFCRKECSEALECGHLCKSKCCKNRKLEAHPPCRTRCGRAFNSCGHNCSRYCHAVAGDDCGLCQDSCEGRCRHSRCSKTCSEPCTPCAEQCVRRCPHQVGCHMPCSVPCDMIPCSKRCELILPGCGHRCPSICGETCPPSKYCQECAEDEIKDHVVDFLMMETYKEINLDENPIVLLPCGHFFGMETLDGQVSFSSVYAQDEDQYVPRPQGEWDTKIQPNQLRCPQCRGSLGDVGRYSRITKALNMQQSVKKFISTSVARWCDLEMQVAAMEKSFSDNPPSNIKSLEGAKQRYNVLGPLLTDLLEYSNSIAKDEEPYYRIRALVLDTIRRQRVIADENHTSFIAEDTTVATRQRVLAMSLHLRAAWAATADIYKVSENKNLVDLRRRHKIGQNASFFIGIAREMLHNTAQGTPNPFPTHEVEARVFDARFTGIHLQLTSTANNAGANPTAEETKVREGILAAALQSLDIAKSVCEAFPGSTSGLSETIDDARSVLGGGTFNSPVTPEEQRQVFEAMRRELGGSGTGHWYYCVNRHLFTIGECGMAMELAKCPQCDAPIGGQNHTSVAGVQRATDFEDQNAGHHRREGIAAQFDRMRL